MPGDDGLGYRVLVLAILRQPAAVQRQFRLDPETIRRRHGIAIRSDKMERDLAGRPARRQRLARDRDQSRAARQRKVRGLGAPLLETREVLLDQRLRQGHLAKYRRRLVVKVRDSLDVNLVAVAQRLVRLVAAFLEDQRVARVELGHVLGNELLERAHVHPRLRRFEAVGAQIEEVLVRGLTVAQGYRSSRNAPRLISGLSYK